MLVTHDGYSENVASIFDRSPSATQDCFAFGSSFICSAEISTQPGPFCQLKSVLTIWDQSHNSIHLSSSTWTHDKAAVLSNHHGRERITRVDLGAKFRRLLFQYLSGDLKEVSSWNQSKQKDKYHTIRRYAICELAS